MTARVASMRSPLCEHDAFGGAGFDARCSRTGAPSRTSPPAAVIAADHRGDDRVGAAAPERHAESSGSAIDSRYGNSAPPAQSGEKSRCMPQIAIMVLSLSFSKFSSSHSRGEATQEPHRVGDPRGAARAPRRKDHAQRLPATATASRASAKICGASCAERRGHGAPALRRPRRSTPRSGSAFASRLRSTPSQLPSGNAVAKHARRRRSRGLAQASDPCGRQRTASRRTGPDSWRRGRGESRAG